MELLIRADFQNFNALSSTLINMIYMIFQDLLKLIDHLHFFKLF